MTTSFDGEFLSRNRFIISKLRDADALKHKRYRGLEDKNAESRKWIAGVRSHLAMSERMYQNVCINV